MLAYKSSVDDLVNVLKSDFVKFIYERTTHPDSNDALVQAEQFKRIILQIYDRKFLFETMQLACSTPQYLLSIAESFVDDLVAKKLCSHLTWSKTDYRGFAQLDANQLKNFPAAKQKIEASIMKKTDEIVKSGNLNDIPTIKLLLLGLSRKEDLHLLQRSSCTDLLKAICNVPTMFFHNIHSSFNPTFNKTLKPFRQGETMDIVQRLEVINLNKFIIVFKNCNFDCCISIFLRTILTT